MKTAEPKKSNATSSSKDNKPFFDKGPHAFFASDTIQQKSAFFQAKLNIGQPGDHFEKEADNMADKVVQRLANPGAAKVEPAHAFTPVVQAKCASCEQEEKMQKKEEEEKGEEEQLQRKPIFDSNAEKDIQRKCAECEKEEKIHKKDGPAAPAAPAAANASKSNLESSLKASKGNGAPLSDNVRSQMESSMGADFSGVRVHTNSSAVQMNKDLNAQAFTHGSDIYFNAGKYDTTSTAGKHLLAHELTHTVQQGKSPEKSVQRAPAAGVGTTPAAPANCGLTPGATPPATIADVTQKCPSNVGEVIDGAPIRININKLRVKANAPETLLDKIKAEGKPLPKPGSRADNPTKQITIWNNLVKDQVEKSLTALLGAIDTAHTPPDKQNGANKYIVKLKTGTGTAVITGSFAEIVKGLLISKWNSDGKPTAFQVEHIIDYQIAGQKADAPENMMLLSAAVNNDLGQLMKNYIQGDISAILNHYNQYIAPGKLETTVDKARENYEIYAKDTTKLAPTVKPDEEILVETLNDAAKTPLRNSITELAPLNLKPDQFILKSAKKGTGVILAYKLNKYNIGSFELTTDGKLNADGQGGTITKIEAKRILKGNHTEGGDEKPETFTLTPVPNETQTYKADNFGNKMANLRLKYLSLVEFEEPDLDEGLNIVAKGVIKAPSPKFLKNTPIEVFVTGRDISIQKTFSADQLGSVGPIKVEEAALTFSLSTESGFGASGLINFSIPKTGKGQITAKASKDGFALNGTFNFDTKTFDKAEISVGYDSANDKGEKDPWDIKGELTIGKDKVKGINSASIIVSYKNKILSFDGKADLNIPGIKSAAVKGTYGGDAFSLSLTTHFDFKSKFIQEPNITVTLGSGGEGDDNKGISLGVSGDMKLVIPHFKTSTIKIKYIDGTFDASAQIDDLSAGKYITGSILLGLTNAAVNPDTGEKAKTGEGKEWHLYGAGTINIKLSERINQTLSIKLTQEGKILIGGELTIKEQPLLNKEKLLEYRKQLFDIATPNVPVFSVGVGDVFIRFEGTGGVMADIYTPTLSVDLKLKDTDIFDPSAAELTAKITPQIKAEAGVDLGIKFIVGASVLVLEVSANIGGTLKLHAVTKAEAELNVAWSVKDGLKFKPSSATLNGKIEAGGEISGGLSVDLHLFTFHVNVWKKDWVLGTVKFGELGQVNLNFPFEFDEKGDFKTPGLDKLTPPNPLASKGGAEEMLSDKVAGGKSEKVEKKPQDFEKQFLEYLTYLPAIGPTNPQYSVERGRHFFVEELGKTYPKVDWSWLRTEWSRLEHDEFQKFAFDLAASKSIDKRAELEYFAANHTTVSRAEIDAVAATLQSQQNASSVQTKLEPGADDASQINNDANPTIQSASDTATSTNPVTQFKPGVALDQPATPAKLPNDGSIIQLAPDTPAPADQKNKVLPEQPDLEGDYFWVSGTGFYYITTETIEWNMNRLVFWDYPQFGLVVLNRKKRPLKEDYKIEDLARSAVVVWENGTGVTMKFGQALYQYIVTVATKNNFMDGWFFVIHLDYEKMKIVIDEKLLKEYVANVQAEAGKSIYIMLASGDIVPENPTVTKTHGKQSGLSQKGKDWPQQKQKQIDQLIKTAKDKGKGGLAPDKTVLWQNEKTGDWYINIWVFLDKAGKEKAARAIKIDPSDTDEDLQRKMAEATTRAANELGDQLAQEKTKDAPEWAKSLVKALQQYFDKERSKDKDAKDIPAGLNLAMVAKDKEVTTTDEVQVPQKEEELKPSISVWVERGTGDKMQRKTGSVPLVQSATLDLLIPYIRHLTTLLNQYENISTDKDKNAPDPEAMLKDPSKLYLSAFPAEIMAKDLREDNLSVTSGKNEFVMELNFEDVYGTSGSMTDLYIASKLYSQAIYYYWSIFKVPESMTEAIKNAGGGDPWGIQWQKLYGDYNNADDSADQKLAKEAKLNEPVSKTDGRDMDRRLKLPPDEGIYLIKCITAHQPIGDYSLKRRPSLAYYPIKLLPIKTFGHAAVSLRTDAMQRAEEEIKAIETLVKSGKLSEKDTKIWLIKQKLKQEELGRLKEKETQTVGENTQAEILYATGLVEKVIKLEQLMPSIIQKAKDTNTAPSDQLQDQLDLYELYWFLLSEGKSPKAYREELEEKMKQLRLIRDRATEFNKDINQSSPYQYAPEAAFVSEVTGKVYPLVLMVGQAPIKQQPYGAAPMILYTVADITSSQTQHFYTGRSTKKGAEGHHAAIDDAFEEFGKDATYGEGIIAVRFTRGKAPVDDPNRPDEGIKYYDSQEGLLQKVLWALGIIGAVAGAAALIATGVGAPAAAGILGALAAGAGAISAIHNISRRQAQHKLEWDAEMALDVISIVAIVPLAAGARLATLPRTASNFRSLQVAGRFLELYAVSEMGTTAVLIPVKLAQDIQRIENDPELTPEQKKAMIEEAKLGALQGGMMLLGGAAAHYAGGSSGRVKSNFSEDVESYHQQAQLMEMEGLGEYKSLEDRHMLDGEGKWTDEAPDFVKNRQRLPEEHAAPKAPAPADHPAPTDHPATQHPAPADQPATQHPAPAKPAEPEPVKPAEPIPAPAPAPAPEEPAPSMPADPTPAPATAPAEPAPAKPSEPADPSKTTEPAKPSEPAPPAPPAAPAAPEPPAPKLSPEDQRIANAEAAYEKAKTETVKDQEYAKEAKERYEEAVAKTKKAKKADKAAAKQAEDYAKQESDLADEVVKNSRNQEAQTRKAASELRQGKLAEAMGEARKAEQPTRDRINSKQKRSDKLGRNIQKNNAEIDRLRSGLGRDEPGYTREKAAAELKQIEVLKQANKDLDIKRRQVDADIKGERADLVKLQAETLKRQEALQAEQREGIGITRETYAKLRKGTPTDEIRAKFKDVKMDSVYPNEPIVGTPEADHIVSMNEITQMDGFSRLEEHEQLEVLNLEANFMPLDKRVNSSKGDRSFSEWDGYSEFGDIDPQIRKDMLVKEDTARKALQDKIKSLDPLYRKK